jgi:methyl-accepting chemotaxis protein
MADQSIFQITETMQQVAAGSAQQAQSVNGTAVSIEQMGRAIDGVARGAQEQATGINRVTDVISRVSASIQQVNSSAAVGEAESAQAAETAKSSAQTLAEMITGMQDIRQKVRISSEKIEQMGSRSVQINAILETIEEIASQTNLLALNAAIEAARAGEHGKGFAVVADEVRKLAEKSMYATDEIGALVKAIQDAVDDATGAMNEGARAVEAGVERAGQSNQALQFILSSVETASSKTGEIVHAVKQMDEAFGALIEAVDSVGAVVEENTAAAEEMAAGSNEVNQAITNIASISEENSASIEEVSASTLEIGSQVSSVSESAEVLRNVSIDLRAVVNNFKFKKEDENIPEKLDFFKRVHLRWVSRLNDHFSGKVEVKKNQVIGYQDCILTKWCGEDGQELFGSRREYAEIDEWHRQLHQHVSQALDAHEHGNPAKARAEVENVQQQADRLAELLDSLAGKQVEREPSLVGPVRR